MSSKGKTILPRARIEICLGMASVLALVASCSDLYPEVIVVNRTAEHIQIKRISFNGCVWNEVLGYDDATTPGRCLPGEDRVHFQKFNALAYAEEQEKNEEEGEETGKPAWFNYQTISVYRADYGDFILILITLDDMEQDFSVPGPYGH